MCGQYKAAFKQRYECLKAKVKAYFNKDKTPSLDQLLKVVPEVIVRELDDEYFFISNTYSTANVAWLLIHLIINTKGAIARGEYLTLSEGWVFCVLTMALHIIKVRPNRRRLQELLKLELL